jgi:uncharacterized OB-fold protein
MSPAKPLPLVDDDTRAYWAGLARGELLLQHCLDCGAVQFYQRGMCGRCLGPRIEHRAASGRGSVYSFSTVYRAPSAEFKGDVPYTVVLVALTEGPRMLSTLVDCPPDRVHVGLPVEIVYDRISDEVALPRFRPAPVLADPGTVSR